MRKWKFGFLIMLLAFMFLSCTMQPITDTSRYEIFGENIGVYMKAAHPGSVAKTLKDVQKFEKMSDVDLIAADVIGAAYRYAMENHPEDRNLAFLVKSGVDLTGLKVDVSKLPVEKIEVYTKCIRAVITGYLKGVM